MLKQNSNTTPLPLLYMALALAGWAVLLWQPPYLAWGLPLRTALIWTAIQSGSAIGLIMACLFRLLVVPEWRRWRIVRQQARRLAGLTGRMTTSEAEDLFLGPGWCNLLSGLDRRQDPKLRPK